MTKTIEASHAEPVRTDRQLDLREMTDARVALGRHGAGLPTQAQLSFLLDHARAREAVWTGVDREELQARLVAAGFAVMQVDSLAEDRSTYVRRPDLGRLLAEEGALRLAQISRENSYDVAIVVADGLSSSAVELNAAPLIEVLAPRLVALNLSLAPIVLASQARVAFGDPVGDALGARLTVVLIGERPGLSAADSLGAYVTYDPKPGHPDSRRNCVSNIRNGGLPMREAAEIITGLVRDMIKTRVSGVTLRAATAKLTAQS